MVREGTARNVDGLHGSASFLVTPCPGVWNDVPQAAPAFPGVKLQKSIIEKQKLKNTKAKSHIHSLNVCISAFCKRFEASGEPSSTSSSAR